MTSPFRAVAAWTSPAAVAVAAAAVYAGAPAAAFLVLALVVAPLVALLEIPRAADGAVAWARAAVAAAVLGSSLRVLGDAGRLHGVPAAPVVLVAAAVAVVVTSWPALAGRAFVLVPVGVAALAVAPVAVGVAAGLAPWRAWSETAVRPALVFAAGSVAVTTGQPIFDDATLAFAESQRVVTLTAGVYRTLEDDGGQPAAREWWLAAGESLMVRAGDRLLVPAGARLRFEAGKRVPGVAASGIAWASEGDPHALVVLPRALGVAVALLGGAVALVRPPGPARSGLAWTPFAVLVAALAPAASGVYAVWAAPELGLGAPWVAPLIRLPAVALPPDAGRWAGVAVAAGLAALFLALACALRESLAAAAGRPRALDAGVWAAVVIVAVALAHGPVDAATVFWLGLGLAAASVAAPALATGDRRAVLVGSLAGGAALAVVVVAARGLGPASALGETLGRYPAILAAPLAWTVARLQRAADS
jgi:hypothetical protein